MNARFRVIFWKWNLTICCTLFSAYLNDIWPYSLYNSDTSLVQNTTDTEFRFPSLTIRKAATQFHFSLLVRCSWIFHSEIIWQSHKGRWDRKNRAQVCLPELFTSRYFKVFCLCAQVLLSNNFWLEYANFQILITTFRAIYWTIKPTIVHAYL